MIQNLPLQQIDAIAPMWFKLNELHKTFDLLINTKPRTGSWADRKNELLLKCAHGHHLQVAWIDEVLIGYCFSSLRKGGIGEIDSLYIEPQARRQGIGRQLIEAALRWLAEQGCEDIKLWVHPSNTEATAFYGRLGFTACPQMQEFTETLLLWTPLCGATEG
jgi:ribosomal protein S18 acetylase RimI-like enzyme